MYHLKMIIIQEKHYPLYIVFTIRRKWRKLKIPKG